MHMESQDTFEPLAIAKRMEDRLERVKLMTTLGSSGDAVRLTMGVLANGLDEMKALCERVGIDPDAELHCLHCGQAIAFDSDTIMTHIGCYCDKSCRDGTYVRDDDLTS